MDQLLTREQAAELLGIHPQTFDALITDGHIKRVVISPRTFRYRTSDITTHLEKGIVA